MKRLYCRADNNYWQWEKTGEIFVFGLLGVSQEDVATVVDRVTETIRELGLPLKINNGNEERRDDLSQLENFIQKCICRENKVDFDCLEDKLTKFRRQEKRIKYSVVILVDDKGIKFKNDPTCRNPAIFGCSSAGGLIVLRGRYIHRATKHEFGHMIGLESHHENCVMDYCCGKDKFGKTVERK